MKKGLIFCIAALLMLMPLAACGSRDESEEVPENPDIVMVAGQAGLGDKDVNDACWAGCTRASEELDIEIYCIESERPEEYHDSIVKAAGMEPALVICADPDMGYALIEAANENPEQHFAIVDAAGTTENTAGLTFRENEASFLAGIAAALTSEEKIVSFIGGEQSLKIDRFQYGFEAGIKTADEKVYINNQYIGSFDDKEEAEKIARAHAALGSDVIYQAAGRSDAGIAKAVKDEKVWIINVCRDYPEASDDSMLCSVVKKADAAVYEFIKATLDSGFDGKDRSYGISEGAIDIEDAGGNLPENAKTEIEKYREKIEKGKIKVPYDWQTCWDYINTLKKEK